MVRSELLEILAQGENSGIEFKRDNIRPEQLAKEIAAFANFQGGRVLLGVEDDGSISGLQRPDTQEWVLHALWENIHPQIIPYYEEITLDKTTKIAVISVSSGISKPYVIRHNNREDIYIRMGDRSEPVSQEQQSLLLQSGILFHSESFPVPNTGFEQLDITRMIYYLEHIIQDPAIPHSRNQWIDRLLDMDLMTDDGLGHSVCSVAGLICFGFKPREYLPQAGLHFMSFVGPDKKDQVLIDTTLDGSLTAGWKINASQAPVMVDQGIIETLIDLIIPFVSREDDDINEYMHQEKNWYYPEAALREVIINALVHRDWTRSAVIEICSHSDRIEITSPGRLPNAMTVKKMIAGQRFPRNPLILQIMRDYAYVDTTGMGIRKKVLPLMRSMNQAEPICYTTDDYVQVILPRRKR